MFRVSTSGYTESEEVSSYEKGLIDNKYCYIFYTCLNVCNQSKSFLYFLKVNSNFRILKFGDISALILDSITF